MEIFTLILVLGILAETSFLTGTTIKNKSNWKTGRRKIYVDTSVLIDGRIIGIANSGFLDGDLILLKSVLRELQLLADGRDSERRFKARNGLENASELERIEAINVEIVDDAPERPHIKVDEQLLIYARDNKGSIMTMDYNLIKVAQAEKIPTLNINELALAARVEFVEGEKVWLKITEKGTNRGQGVGHLHNGTMVVVNKAADKVGKEILVELTKYHETPAGKIMFAQLVKGQREIERKKVQP